MSDRLWPPPGADRAFVLVAVLGSLAVATWTDLSPRVESDFFFSPDDPQLQASLEIARRFPRPPQIIVRAEGANIEAPAYRSALERLTDDVRAVPGITTVYGIASESPGRSPLWARLLLTPSERASNLVLQTDGTAPEPIVDSLEAIVAGLDGPDFSLEMSGVPVIVERIRRALFRDLVVFSGAALVVFGLLVGAVYRDRRIVLGTLSTCLIACASTLLVTNAAGISIGLLTANIVTIVFVLTLSHVVFLTSNWRRVAVQEREAGEVEVQGTTVDRAVRTTLGASFWCMVTTLLGFLSLLVASARPLRELGIAGAVGTVVALVVAFGVYPAFLHAARSPSGGGGPVRVVERLPEGGRARWLGVTALVVAALGTGLFRLDTDPGLLTYFARGSEIRRGLELIDRDGGSSTLDVVIRDAAGGRIDDPAVYDRMWAFQDALEADSAVGVVISPPVLLSHARQQPLAGFLSLSVLLGILESDALDRVARAFVSPDRSEGRFFLRMREADRRGARASVIGRIEDYARDAGLEPVLVAGLYDLQGQLGRLIASSLRIGLGGLLLLFVVVALTVSRTLRIAGIMVLSLTGIPLVVLGTFGHLGVAVDIITSPAANVALAMGVDSMIHLVVRARALSSGPGIDWSAWLEARRQMAVPILAATLIICTGFGIFGLSTFPPTRRFGLAVILGTATAALMALVVLPLAARNTGPDARPEAPGEALA